MHVAQWYTVCEVRIFIVVFKAPTYREFNVLVLKITQLAIFYVFIYYRNNIIIDILSLKRSKLTINPIGN